MDVRPGGKWRIGPKAGEQGPAFVGEFLEVIPPERFVRTGVPDRGGPAGPPAVETVTFEDLGGRTKMVYHVRFPSDEVLVFALSEGMTKGVLEQFHRLADLLTELAH